MNTYTLALIRRRVVCLVTMCLLATAAIAILAAEPEGKGGKGKKKPAGDKPVAKTSANPPVPNKPAPPGRPEQAKKQNTGRASDLVAGTNDNKKSDKKKDKDREPKSTGNVGLLQEGYRTLALGNHVYDGHRRAAMNQLDKAAHVLGADFSGDGRGGEQRIISDAQLLAVKLILERGRGSFTGAALEHVDSAIKELGTALSLPKRR